jgi:outer membrane protein assembly factor BamB
MKPEENQFCFGLCRVAAGTLLTLLLTATVLAQSPTITNQPQSQAVTVGSNVTFSVGATGAAPLHFQWRKGDLDVTDGGRISGAATASLTVSNVQTSDAGSYAVVVSNSLDSVTSEVATLTVTVPPGSKLWEFTTGGAVHSSPAIGTDGTVYVGSSDGKVYALDGSTGAKRWEYATGGAIRSSPAIGSDGTVYVGSGDWKIYALDGATGAKRWEFVTGWAALFSPSVGADGTVFVASLDGNFYALDGAKGTNRWQFTGGSDSAPAIAADGTVYVGASDHKLYAVDGATGTNRWGTAVGDYVSAAIGADGTVYAGSGATVYALDAATGAKRWEFTADSSVAFPTIGVDGTVYVGSAGHKVYALDGLLGHKRWEFSTGGLIYSSPASGADGTVYVSSNDGKLYALDGNTGAKLWHFETATCYDPAPGCLFDSSPAISTNGILYVGSSNGKVYAVKANSDGGLANSAWPMFLQNVQHTGRAVPPSGGSIQLNLDLTQPAVATSNVVARSLFYASESQPISYGAVGIGSFSKWASVTFPFNVSAPGAYRVVVTYGLTKQMRPITVKIDGALPDPSWQNVTLWASAPDYPLGAIGAGLDHENLDCTSPNLVCWTLSDTPVALTPGPHTVELIFPEGEIIVTRLLLTTGQTPTNPAKPWTLDSYVPFPALDFTNRVLEPLGDRLRYTFQGVWQNLAPHPVSFQVSAAVMPRKGYTQTLYQITNIQPSPLLALNVGERVPFQLTVESTGPVPDKYSELIQLKLASLDVTNLFKPYLMCAAKGYLDVRPDVDFRYVYGYEWYMGIQDGTSPESVIPTRTTLDSSAGYPKRTLNEAFLCALSNAPQPVFSLEKYASVRANYTAWARAGAPLTWSFDNSSELAVNWDGTLNRWHPLARILAGQGQRVTSTGQLKAMMGLLSQEMPYYPIEGRWDASRLTILPKLLYEYSGVAALASYIRLAQTNAMSDDEHFRFLHNVVLPLYLAYRDDLRINGTLAQPIFAQVMQTNPVIYLARPTPPKILPQDMIANNIDSWLRIGTDPTMEYIHVSSPGSPAGQVSLSLFLPKYDHAAGEPWASFAMREWMELEGSDIWSYLSAAVASRDSAVVEQVADILEVLYSTQDVFREDGSFADEPGSYGMDYATYLWLYQQMNLFLGGQASLSPAARDRMLNAAVMWNDFPFSDGVLPMLNGGGAVNQIPRLGEDLDVLREVFPTETNFISRYQEIAQQEASRSPGTFVGNRSFKVDGWGYAMLRGPGSWDARMETLLSSKKLNFDPGDHVSNDSLGLCLFAHGALMTPRYGYHWIGYPALLINRDMIDRQDPRIWGDFLHFDDDPSLPSAIAYTDMATPHETTPGVARQERWDIQMPEYLFDAFFVKPRDGQAHSVEWGFKNLGEVAIASPPVTLTPALEDDGVTSWDPFGYYRQNTGHDGQQFVTSQMWQADWTMNQGSIVWGPTFRNPTWGTNYPYPPVGSKMRLTMVAELNTKIVTAWLAGPGRDESVNLRQDFVTVKRAGTNATFINTFDPYAGQPFVKAVEIVDKANDGSLAVKVNTLDGPDWFLVGQNDLQSAPVVRQVGPFSTDAKIAALRVRGNAVAQVMFSGGTSLAFTNNGVAASYVATGPGPFHAGAPVPIPVIATLIATNSAWKYLADGSDQGTAWRETNFDDSAWPGGPAPLGFGDPFIATTIPGGPSTNHFVTTYFRSHLGVANPSEFRGLALRLMRNDGAVVYLNGTEIFRDNMPTGAVGSVTLALDAVSGAANGVFVLASADAPLLRSGDNVFAVEVHQAALTSPDLNFALEVTGTQSLPPPALATSTQGGQVLLTWPAGASGYALECTTNLTWPVFWKPVTNPPWLLNGRLQFPLTPTNPANFYRLQRP